MVEDKRALEGRCLALMGKCLGTFEHYEQDLVEKSDFTRAKEVAAATVAMFKAVEMSVRYGDSKAKGVGSGVLTYDDLGSEESLRKLRPGDVESAEVSV